jgi:acyl-CoA thioesterase I
MATARSDSVKGDTTSRAQSFSSRVPTVVFFGTSLTAGPGLEPEEAYPALVEKLAAKAGTPIEAVNAGLSGETTAGAVRRIDWVLKNPADLIVIETGANDALRGLSPDSARSNIEKVVASVKEKQPDAKIALIQMEAPPNFGSPYVRRFHAIYGEVAKREDVILLPFLLNNVAGLSRYNQADGVHPNAEGAKIVADNVWKSIAPLVKELTPSR